MESLSPRLNFILASLGASSSEVIIVLDEHENSTIKKYAPSQFRSDDFTQQIEVDQWLSFSTKFHLEKDKLKDQQSVIDLFLSDKSYLVGHNVSIADLSVFYLFYESYESLDIIQYPALKRWFNHIQYLSYKNNKTIDRKAIQISNTIIRIPHIETVNSINNEAINLSSSPSTTEVVVALPVEKKSKQESTKGNVSNSTPPTATPTVELDLDPSKLDIRCGIVVKCWNHPGMLINIIFSFLYHP